MAYKISVKGVSGPRSYYSWEGCKTRVHETSVFKLRGDYSVAARIGYLVSSGVGEVRFGFVGVPEVERPGLLEI